MGGWKHFHPPWFWKPPGAIWATQFYFKYKYMCTIYITRTDINTNRNDTHHHLIDGVHNVVHLSPAIETIKSLPLSVFQTFKNHLSMEKQELVES